MSETATVIGANAATAGTPETPLVDIFAMEVELLTIVKIGTMVNGCLRLKGCETVQYRGNPDETWRDVFGKVIELAAENRRAHT